MVTVYVQVISKVYTDSHWRTTQQPQGDSQRRLEYIGDRHGMRRAAVTRGKMEGDGKHRGSELGLWQDSVLNTVQ